MTLLDFAIGVGLVAVMLACLMQQAWLRGRATIRRPRHDLAASEDERKRLADTLRRVCIECEGLKRRLERSR